MNVGGVVLCGGESRRMGRPKALLPFAGEPLVARVARLVGQAVGPPLVVVAAAGQELPPLPLGALAARDRRPGLGPLEAIAAGLTALAGIHPPPEAALVVSCDAPLLSPAFARRIVSLLGEHQAAAPRIDGLWRPLAAVYRLSALPVMERMLAADQRRMSDLLERLSAREISAAELQDVDPELRSLVNVNRPEEYARALAWADEQPPH